MTTVGILALQGCIEPHQDHFARLGVETVGVRHQDDLAQIQGLVLPGGESTTMLRLLKRNELFEPLREFVAKYPAWGICAGSILLASEVVHPDQESLSVARLRAERNSYGSQRESFSTQLSVEGFEEDFTVDFIRAPRLFPLSDEVEILATYNEDNVLIKDRHLLCSAFHTELTDDSRLHQYFVEEFLH